MKVSWLSIGVFLAAVLRTAHGQLIVKMVDCKISSCVSISTDAPAVAETEIPLKFQLASPKTMKLLSATYMIVPPDGKPAFEAPLAIRKNGSATPYLELDKAITPRAAEY